MSISDLVKEMNLSQSLRKVIENTGQTQITHTKANCVTFVTLIVYNIIFQSVFTRYLWEINFTQNINIDNCNYIVNTFV